MRSPPSATADATIAIWSGVAVVSNCPIDDSASWSSVISVSKLLFATPEGIRSPVSLKPNFCTASTMPLSPTRTPRSAITVLQETRIASASEASSQPRASLGSVVEVPGSTYGDGVSVSASGSVTTSASSAAAAVTTLKVEPGG